MPPGLCHLMCPDGRVYTASLPAIRWRPPHTGTSRYRRCPGGRKWRGAVPVNPSTLTGAEPGKAAAHCA